MAEVEAWLGLQGGNNRPKRGMHAFFLLCSNCAPVMTSLRVFPFMELPPEIRYMIYEESTVLQPRRVPL